MDKELNTVLVEIDMMECSRIIRRMDKELITMLVEIDMRVCTTKDADE